MNLLLAYLLWLPPMGWFGLHHFYMRRDLHGFLMLTTFGGFVAGYIRDLFCISRFLKESRRDKEYQNLYLAEVTYHKHPGVWRNRVRYAAMAVLASYYRGFVVLAIPEQALESDMWAKVVALALAPLGTAFGTYSVANIGNREVSFLPLLLLAYVGEVVFGWWQPGEFGISTWMWLQPFIIITFIWSYVNPKSTPVRPGCCLRFWRVVLGVLILTSLSSSFLYHNATIETEDGETILLRDAMENLLRSEAWKHFKEEFWTLLDHLWQHGWEGLADDLYNISERSGIDWAAGVLNVSVTSSEREVKTRYRELVRVWHPDHAQDKALAQEKFIEIQKAYDTFMRKFKRQKRKGFKETSWFEEEEEEEDFDHDEL